MNTLLTSKPLAIALTIIGSLIIILLYIAANETIKDAAPVLFWCGVAVIAIMAVIGILVFVVTQFERLATLRVQMKSTRIIAEAEADKAAMKAQQPQIITAPPGHQVVAASTHKEMIYTQIHLAPNQRVNGDYIEPTETEKLAFMAYQSRVAPQSAVDEPLVIEANSVTSPPVDVLNQYDDKWIDDLLLAPHIHYCGATRSGKTTLANHQIMKIQTTSPGAEFHLINPKETAARTPFIIEPGYKDIDEAIEGLQTFNTLMLARKNDPTLSAQSHKIVFIIDEWDWIYETYGNEAKRLLVPLVKVGAELNISVILIGQSPLTGDTGLSQSFYHNMVRVAIWQEGARLLNNYPLDRKYKAPLMAQYESLKALGSVRYCVMVPMSGNPKVEVIPHIDDPVKAVEIEKGKTLRPIKGSYDEKVCQVWYQISKTQYPNCNQMHKFITGKDTNVNSKQRDKYRILLKKYGISPSFF